MYHIVRPILPSYVRPAIYSLQLRSGAQNILIKFRWDGGGSVRLEIVSPKKVYTEDEMKITDKTSIQADGTIICKYLRQYGLSIPKLPHEEMWSIQLNLANICRYQLDVEVS